MSPASQSILHPVVVQQLLDAVNHRDLAALVACFAEDYVNRTPAHPRRGFRGREQVRRNWDLIFAEVPDVQARVSRSAADGSTLWTEWQISGTRRSDGTVFAMAGVVIYEVAGDLIDSASFYLEPVEQVSGDIDAATHRVVSRRTEPKDKS